MNEHMLRSITMALRQRSSWKPQEKKITYKQLGIIIIQRHLKDGLPSWLRWSKICLQCRRPGFSPWVGKIPWRREWLPTAESLPGEFHGQRSLVGYSPWGQKESDTTEWLTHTLIHTSGRQCQMLENDGAISSTFWKEIISNIEFYT